MLISGLAVLSGTSTAQVINQPNDYNIRIGGTDLDNHARYRGENLTFYVEIENNGGQTIYHCNLSINSDVHDENGDSVISPFIWKKQGINDDATIGTGWYNTHTFSGFNAVIKSDAAYGTYNVTAKLTFKNSTGAVHSYEGWILFRIAPRMYVYSTSGTYMYPGEVNHRVNVGIDSGNHETVYNVTVTLNAPDKDFTFNGSDPARVKFNMGDLDNTDFWAGIERHFTTNVTKDKNAGGYPLKWTVKYRTNDGFVITDEGSFNLTVRSLGTIEMSSNVKSIDRGTSTMMVTLTINNTGNMNLTNLKIKLDDVTRNSGYFMLPQEIDHYEGSHPVYKSVWVDVGNVSKGGSIQTDLKIIVDSHLPAGEHKVLFDFMADTDKGMIESDWHYYCCPSDGSPSHYIPRWTGDFLDYEPKDTQTMHPGAFIMVNVTGQVFDMDVNPIYGLGVPSVSMVKEENFLELKVSNNEARTYRDMSFVISTGPDSPFMNPSNTSSEWSEPYNVTRLSAYSTAIITLRVSVKPGTTAGYYEVPMMIKGTDLTTSKEVSVDSSTRVLIVGSGAKPVITDISYGDIKAGQTFKVTLTVTNNGDDVARNLFVNLMVSPDQDNIALINGAPRVDSLAPGQSTTLEYTFVASPHIDASHAYPITAEMSYDNMYKGNSDTVDQQIGVSASSGSVNMKDITNILVMILLIIAIIGGILLLTKGMKKENPPAAVQQPAPEPEPAEGVEEMPPVEEPVEETPVEGEDISSDLVSDENEGETQF